MIRLGIESQYSAIHLMERIIITVSSVDVWKVNQSKKVKTVHIKKGMPSESYTKIDNRLWSRSDISDGALRLYGFIASLPNGKVITDAYIIKSLGWSQRTVSSKKKELKEAKLLLMVKISARVHDLYLGYSRFTAEQVKAMWEDDELYTEKE